MTAALALRFILAHRRAFGAGLLALSLVVAGAWLASRVWGSKVEKAEARAAAAQGATRAAIAQVHLDAASTAAVETARTTQAQAAAQTGAAADAILPLPHAQDRLDADVLREWAAAVDGMRDPRPTRARATPPVRAGGAPRAVPPPRAP